jgi:hypothetical protein
MKLIRTPNSAGWKPSGIGKHSAVLPVWMRPDLVRFTFPSFGNGGERWSSFDVVVSEEDILAALTQLIKQRKENEKKKAA